MRLSLSLFFIVLLNSGLYCQEDVCACASYNSFDNKESFEKLFPVDLMKQHGIKEIMVYNTVNKVHTEDNGNESTNEIGMKYRETKYSLSSDGLITSRISFNRMGQYHSLYEYERNQLGNITKQSFNYLDSLGRKILNWNPQIIDYEYDSKGRMIKSKNRDSKGNVVDDDKTNYVTITYDEMDRRLSYTVFFYYDWTEPSKSIRTYKYSDSDLTGSSKTFRNGELGNRSEMKFNDSWTILSEKSYNVKAEAFSFSYRYNYDVEGRLVEFELKAGQGGGSECPDGGTFKEKYIYKDGLLVELLHRFDDNLCRLTIEYK